MSEEMVRETPGIFIYLCHCGESISGDIDFDYLAEYASGLPGVLAVRRVSAACSREGQALMRNDLSGGRDCGAVLAACTPFLHSCTFRNALEEAGVSPSRISLANIREQCAWPHAGEVDRATDKALDLVAMAAARLSHLRLDGSDRFPVSRGALVIGGGIAGIQAALDLAGNGFPVTLLEKEPFLGGILPRLERIFPGLDSPLCVLGPRLADVEKRPEIEALTGSRVEDVSGEPGNYEIKVLVEPRHVGHNCTGCGACLAVCPVEVPDALDAGFSSRKAIYRPFEHSYPPAFVIDRKACLGLNGQDCDACARACPEKAVDLSLQAVERTVRAGAVVMATGMLPQDPGFLEDYGYNRLKNVITSLELEALLRTGGPAGGKLRGLKVPGSVAFIQCSGSQAEPGGWAGGGSLTWVNTLKEALSVRERWPDTRVFVFYTEMQSPGKSHEELYARARRAGVQFIRGLPAEITRTGENLLLLRGENTLLKELYRLEVSLAVLAPGFVPTLESEHLRRLFRLRTDPSGYLLGGHPATNPVEDSSRAVWGAGTAMGPRDIRDSVLSAGAAAAGMSAFLRREFTRPDPALSSECAEEEILSLIDVLATYEPEKKILVLACSGAYQAIDMAGTLRLAYPAETFVIHTACSSGVSRRQIIRALGRGIGGLMVAGCEPDECLRKRNPESARELVNELSNFLEKAGVTPGRLCWTAVSTREPGEFVSSARRLAGIVSSLGEAAIREESERLAGDQKLEKPAAAPGRAMPRRKTAPAVAAREVPEQRLEGFLRREVSVRPVERRLTLLEEEASLPFRVGPELQAEQEEPPATMFSRQAIEGKPPSPPADYEREMVSPAEEASAPVSILDFIPEPVPVFSHEAATGFKKEKAAGSESEPALIIKPIAFELPEDRESEPIPLPEVEPFPEEEVTPAAEDDSARSFLEELKEDLGTAETPEETGKTVKTARPLEELPEGLKAILDTEVFMEDSVVEVSLEEFIPPAVEAVPEGVPSAEGEGEAGEEKIPEKESVAREEAPVTPLPEESVPEVLKLPEDASEKVSVPSRAVAPVTLKKGILHLPVKPPVTGWRRGKPLPAKPLPGPFGLGRIPSKSRASIAFPVKPDQAQYAPEESGEVPIDDLMVLRVPEPPGAGK
jgi:heterodisulfide reductase subunit A